MTSYKLVWRNPGEERETDLIFHGVTEGAVRAMAAGLRAAGYITGLYVEDQTWKSL